jgi:hypothetical protein
MGDLWGLIDDPSQPGLPEVTLSIFSNKSINYVNWRAEMSAKHRLASNKQNNFSFLKKIALKNNSGRDIIDSHLHIEASQTEAVRFDDVSLPILLKEKTTDVTDFHFTVNPKYLYRLTESEPGYLTISVKDKNGVVLGQATQDITVLPLEESASQDRIDEILASFITPNDDAVDAIVKKAAEIMQKKYQNPSFFAYQSHDPNDVVQQLDSIYLALRGEEIRYITPPASFEATFQRIRMPFTVLAKKEGTCIDLALLFASVCEAVGLDPILVVMNGHAFAGCWLEENKRLNAREENSSVLLDAASKGSDYLRLINCVDFVASSSIDTQQSFENGRKRLEETPFRYALDVQACRKEGILPVPSLNDISKMPDDSFVAFEASLDAAVAKIDIGIRSVMNGEAAPKNKFDYWEEKLLDLSLRNRLINLRVSAHALQIITSDVDSLFSVFGQKSHFVISLKNVKPPLADEEALDFNREELVQDFRNGLNSGTLIGITRDDFPETDIRNLARRSNFALEDSGSNPLYLAVGLIKWFDNPTAAKKGRYSMYSPIFLVPASLPKRRIGNNYSIDFDIDDISLNTTIFEYFRQNNPELDFSALQGPLPLKPDGSIDARKILNTLRKIITANKEWAILEDVTCLSIFSFAHFVMWKDIKTKRETMLKNPIISSLVKGTQEWKDPSGLVDIGALDEKIDPGSLAVPLPADSSQIKAISDSLSGLSFILDGPPGTGKSQTIANMIVNFLFHGKSVLFVAEKEVALAVVKKRLEEIGLDVFCLNIPSSDTNKKDVLVQIGKTLDQGRTSDDFSFALAAKKVAEKRKELDDIIKKLHKETKLFLPLYESIVRYLCLKDKIGDWAIEESYVRNLNSETFKDAIASLRDLVRYDERFGTIGQRAPLTPFFGRTYDIGEKEKLLEDLIKEREVLSELTKVSGVFESHYFGGVPFAKNELDCLFEINEFLLSDPKFRASDLSLDFLAKEKELIKFGEEALALAQAKEEIALNFDHTIFLCDPTVLSQKYHNENNKNKIITFFEKASVLKTLRSHQKAKHFVKNENASSLIEKLIKIKRLSGILEQSDPFVRGIYSGLCFATSQECAEASEKVSNAIKILNLRDGNGILASETFFDLYAKYVASFGEVSRNQAKRFDELYRDYRNKAALLSSEDKFDLGKGLIDKADYVALSVAQIDDFIHASPRLADWTQYLNVMDKANELLPPSFMEKYSSGKIASGNLETNYSATLYHKLVILGLKDTGLSTLNSLREDEAIALYRQIVREYLLATVRETAYKVTSAYQGMDATSRSSQPYQLRKLVMNNGRGTSLRNIMSTYGELIHQLCPCFLMSPLSIAQFLEVDKHSFNAVIFDEASQLPTCEAVGAIARGESAIIAGDQEQMPPTNFFGTDISPIDDKEDTETPVDDLESLLDDSIALGLPRRRLNCHYRSHYESLIAFSNNRFYNDSLLTFPSPSHEGSAVRFVKVKGNYQRGKGTNPNEAKMVFEEIVRRINDPELAKLSIGVVTFNGNQSSLIQDLLDEYLTWNPTVNSRPGGEEILVKNLENVQGDERDVILFDVTYGPDKTGVMGLNFGPLSRDKGERRLNVAVSRAREEMIVYSSVDPEQIAAERAKNNGADFLRSFLMFAKNGMSALSVRSESVLKTTDGLTIADFIADDLRKKGYLVTTHYGASNFKIDVAVKNPMNHDSYLLGIITDGGSYAEAPTCRDRNIVEPDMLKKLHWNLVRVWSIEYLDSPETVIERIVSEIEKLAKSPAPPTSSAPSTMSELSPKPVFETLPPKNPYPHKVPYLLAKGLMGGQVYLADDFRKIVEAEEPISYDSLIERAKQLVGWKRATPRFLRGVNSAIRQGCFDIEKCGGTAFYWRSLNEMASSKTYRLDYVGEMKRPPAEYSYIELSNLFADILESEGRISVEDLVSSVCRAMDTRNTAAAADYIHEAIFWCGKTNRNGICIVDSSVSLKK